MPSIAAAAPFPALYNPQLSAMGGGGARSASQPLVTSPGLQSPEHLEELWSNRGSPMRMENMMSSAPAPWMSEFNTAGPALAGGSTQIQPQPGLNPASSPCVLHYLLITFHWELGISSYTPYMGGAAGMMYNAPQMFTSTLMQGQVHAPLSFSSGQQQQQQPDWDSEFTKVEAASQDKGKGRLVEVSDNDLEAAFDRLEVDATETLADEPTASLDDYMASFEKWAIHNS